MDDPKQLAIALLLASDERGEAMILSREIISEAQSGKYDIRNVILDDENLRLELIETNTGE